MHSAVGAIIKQNGKILMLDRKKIPLGWACPAGHIEKSDTPERTLIKEVKEETDLQVKKSKLLIHEFVAWNACAKGFAGHDWYVYEILEWQGEAKLMERDKHKTLGWKTIEEIKKIELEEVWQYFFKKLNLL